MFLAYRPRVLLKLIKGNICFALTVSCNSRSNCWGNACARFFSFKTNLIYVLYIQEFYLFPFRDLTNYSLKNTLYPNVVSVSGHVQIIFNVFFLIVISFFVVFSWLNCPQCSFMTLDNCSTRGLFYFFESRPIDPDWKDNIRRIISTLLLNQWEPVEKWSYASINFVSGISILSCIFQLAIQCNSKFHSKWLKNGHSIIQMTIWKQNLNSQIPSTEKQSKWPLFF